MARNKRRSSDYDYYGYGYPRSTPIKPKDGIQSRSQKGAFASSWWAKRWLAVLESYGIGTRLQRGRSYARGGQVLNIDVQPGLVKARVQGSRPKPYDVEIRVAAISDTEWERVLDVISQQAIFAAQLLDGTMPQEIESAFESASVSLFPADIRQIKTECSCPDYANPCKHIAAVYYLLGEQFDRDPFLIFSLRGRTQEQTIEALRQRRAAATAEPDAPDTNLDQAVTIASLDANLAHFWGSDRLDWSAPSIAPPEMEAAVLRRLGAPPGDLRKPLEMLYQAMSQHVQTRLIDGNDDHTD